MTASDVRPSRRGNWDYVFSSISRVTATTRNCNCVGRVAATGRDVQGVGLLSQGRAVTTGMSFVHRSAGDVIHPLILGLAAIPMANRFIQQAAPGLASLKAVCPASPCPELERELGISGSIKLASNENPLGPSPQVRAALQAQIADVPRYPDGGAYELRRALARHHDLEPACVTVGNGSTTCWT